MTAHLHVQSYYSFLDGLVSPGQLVDAASQSGFRAMALTDLNYLSGAIEFYDACRDRGIRPILGLIVTLQPNNRGKPGILTLLAQDQAGWRSLCRLSSVLQDDPEVIRPVLTFDQLTGYSDGVVCLTGGVESLLTQPILSGHRDTVNEALDRLDEIFHHRLYLELQSHTPDDAQWVRHLARIGLDRSIPIVATHTIKYLRPEKAALQKVANAIRVNTTVQDLNKELIPIPGAYFVAPEEFSRRFQEFPESLRSIEDIIERCQLELPLGKPRYPTVVDAEGRTSDQVLRAKAVDGAKRLYLALSEDVIHRLDHELEVIKNLGYASLFLIVEEILEFARENAVPISSRGSAASSLVAHCLGITSPDPLRLNLYFERFLNPARATPPDIDTDLCSRRREQVIRHVYDQYGADRVATVCTINRFRSRSALREVAKAYGLPMEKVNHLAEILPYRWYGSPARRDDRNDPYSEIRGRFPGEPYSSIFRDAAELIGIPHHLSVHPGGIVIAPEPLNNLAPTQMAVKGVKITQFDMDGIERLGLVKIDLLGIRGLTVIGDVAESICQSKEVFKDCHSPLDVLEAIPEDDPMTVDAVRNGRTIGCFQIESPGMRATLKEVQADSVDDIMVALALYRPGPLTGGLKDAFVRRHRGDEPTEHLHPALKPLLEDTHGVILYQEQVLWIAHELAGLSLADADLLRRAMSHFDPGKQMVTLKERFLAGAHQRHDVPAATGEQIWDLMTAFAGYGFPKAHAASYAQIAWRAAWCKTHFPAVFMAAVLANWGGYYSQRVYLMEARRLGLSLFPPLINYARSEFSVINGQEKAGLAMGLDQVRDLTQRTIRRIQQDRPFYTFEDFLTRVDPRPVEVENLVRCGALDEFGEIPALLRRLKLGGWQGGQMSLFSLGTDGSSSDWTIDEKAAAQEAILGTSVIAHPLELMGDAIASSGAMNTVEAAARLGHQVRVVGMRQTWRRTRAAKGDYIYFMALEDLEGMLNVIIFGEVYRRWKKEIDGQGPFVVEGNVEFDPEHNEPIVRAEKVWKL